jgi:pimeloyl-ACP methyl ester carboxylesterase
VKGDRHELTLRRPARPGSVAGAPHLPDGFTGTFTSRYLDTAGLRQHVVTGGDGPPLLLIHGWPQTWYAWRLVMPALARDFTVVAADQRGCGLSGQAPRRIRNRHPRRRPDRADGHTRPPAVRRGRARHRHVDRLRPRRRPPRPGHPPRRRRGSDAGRVPSPPLFGSTATNDRLWHFAFNRLAEVNDQLAHGREDIYFGSQFAKAAKTLPDYAVRHYIDTLAADPAALRGSFAAYRALDATIAQNQQRTTRRLTLPVLAIGGAEGIGEGAATTMKLAADNVQSVVIPGSGHYCLEEAPQEMLATLTAFLAPLPGRPGRAQRPPGMQRGRQ